MACEASSTPDSPKEASASPLEPMSEIQVDIDHDGIQDSIVIKRSNSGPSDVTIKVAQQITHFNVVGQQDGKLITITDEKLDRRPDEIVLLTLSDNQVLAMEERDPITHQPSVLTTFQNNKMAAVQYYDRSGVLEKTQRLIIGANGLLEKVVEINALTDDQKILHTFENNGQVLTGQYSYNDAGEANHFEQYNEAGQLTRIEHLPAPNYYAEFIYTETGHSKTWYHDTGEIYSQQFFDLFGNRTSYRGIEIGQSLQPVVQSSYRYANELGQLESASHTYFDNFEETNTQQIDHQYDGSNWLKTITTSDPTTNFVYWSVDYDLEKRTRTITEFTESPLSHEIRTTMIGSNVEISGSNWQQGSNGEPDHSSSFTRTLNEDSFIVLEEKSFSADELVSIWRTFEALDGRFYRTEQVGFGDGSQEVDIVTFSYGEQDNQTGTFEFFVNDELMYWGTDQFEHGWFKISHKNTYHDLDKDGYGETLEVREYDPDGNETFYSLKCDADQDGHYEVAIKGSCIEGLAIQ